MTDTPPSALSVPRKLQFAGVSGVRVVSQSSVDIAATTIGTEVGGVALRLGDRVLLAGQDEARENGVYQLLPELKLAMYGVEFDGEGIYRVDSLSEKWWFWYKGNATSAEGDSGILTESGPIKPLLIEPNTWRVILRGPTGELPTSTFRQVVLVRAPEMSAPEHFRPGSRIYVSEGTWRGNFWAYEGAAMPDLETTPLTFGGPVGFMSLEQNALNFTNSAPQALDPPTAPGSP